LEDTLSIRKKRHGRANSSNTSEKDEGHKAPGNCLQTEQNFFSSWKGFEITLQKVQDRNVSRHSTEIDLQMGIERKGDECWGHKGSSGMSNGGALGELGLGSGPLIINEIIGH